MAAPTTLSSSATRPSFFNPGGLTTNPFFGGSGNNEVGEDSEVEGDRDREVETNDDSDDQAVQRDDRNDEAEAQAGN